MDERIFSKMFSKGLALSLVCMLTLSACQGKVQSSDEAIEADSVVLADTTYNEPKEGTKEYYMDGSTQLEEEDSVWTLYKKERAEVDADFEKLAMMLPQYKKLFGKEKEKWKEYLEAVEELAKQGFHGMSSWGFYVCDMLRQSVKLRKMSFRNLLLHLGKQEKKTSASRFTSEMIDDAYTIYINAPEILELLQLEEEEEITEYKSVLEKERNCWNEWMKYRIRLSSKLPKPLRRIYDECTNITMREKLRQIKNQNQGVGILSNDLIQCCLPEDCSDKVLLEYPCFNKVWTQHCAEPEWEPLSEIGMDNSKKEKEAGVSIYDSHAHTNRDTIRGHFRTRNGDFDTLVCMAIDSCTVKIYSPSNKLMPLIIDNVFSIHWVKESDLDGNGTEELGIRREQEMGNWQDYSVYTYINNKWMYLIPSVILYGPHFYKHLNYGQDVVKAAIKKGFVQVHYSWFDDDCFLSDTIIKVSPTPFNSCDSILLLHI